MEPWNNYYRPLSEASKGYIFTGVCHFNSGEGEEWTRDMVKTPPSIPPGPGHNTSLPPPRGPGHNKKPSLPPGTWSQHLPPQDLVTTPPSLPPDLVTTRPSLPPGTWSQHLPPPRTWSQQKTLPPPGTWSQHLPPQDLVTTPPSPQDLVTIPPSLPPGPGHNTSLPPPGTWSQQKTLPPLGPGHNTSLLPPLTMHRWTVGILLECIGFVCSSVVFYHTIMLLVRKWVLRFIRKMCLLTSFSINYSSAHGTLFLMINNNPK